MTKDRSLIEDATEIQCRAETRLGELLAKAEKAKGSAGTLRGRNSSGGAKLEPLERKVQTLAEQGIDKESAYCPAPQFVAPP